MEEPHSLLKTVNTLSSDGKLVLSLPQEAVAVEATGCRQLPHHRSVCMGTTENNVSMP